MKTHDAFCSVRRRAGIRAGWTALLLFLLLSAPVGSTYALESVSVSGASNAGPGTSATALPVARAIIREAVEIPPPDIDGPETARIYTEVEFEAHSDYDPLDAHEFQWYFGDGEFSDWDDNNEEISHTYNSLGTFGVRVREVCPLGLFASDWSDEFEITIVSLGPDLVASDSTIGLANARPGDPLYVAWRETSLYEDTSAMHTTGLYISTDSTIGSDDLLLAEPIRVAPVAADNPIDLSCTVNVPDLPSGLYYIGVIVDTWGEVAEYDESNSFTFGGTLTIDNDPDLAPYGTAISTTWAEPGGSFFVGSGVINWSPDPAPGSWVCIYLSTDTIIDSNDTPVVAGFRSPLLNAYSWADSIQLATVPPYMPEGRYYVGVLVDVDNAIVERNETNNTIILGQRFLVGRPDLQFANGSFGPGSVVQGQTVSARTTVVNNGLTTAPATWMLFHLSTDDQITTGDFPIHKRIHVPAIPSGGRYTVVAQPLIPADMPPGSYYLGAYFDFVNSAAERNEQNNAGVLGSRPLVVMAPTDLTIQGFDFAPQLVHPGDELHLTGSIVNLGAPTETGFWAEFFISPNPSLAPPTQVLCESIYVPALGAGQSYSLAGITRRVSGAVAPGEYALGLVVDRPNEVVESNESNNMACVTTKRLYVRQKLSGALKWSLYK
jgi:hypothetical protein